MRSYGYDLIASTSASNLSLYNLLTERLSFGIYYQKGVNNVIT